MEKEPRYLVIPSAGLGTRMESIEPNIPKEMLPVGNKPAIQYAVEEGMSAGIKHVVIIINKQKEIIRKYFEDQKYGNKLFPFAAQKLEEINSKCSIIFLYQKAPLGEADAISLAANIIGESPLAIIYPDNIYFPASEALNIIKPVFRQNKKDIIALITVSDESASAIGNSGRVDLLPIKNNLYRIEKQYTKGDGHFTPRFKRELRTCGFSIRNPHIFEYIERARKLPIDGEFTDGPVNSLMLKDKELLGYRLTGNLFDIGNPQGYKRCLEHSS